MDLATISRINLFSLLREDELEKLLSSVPLTEVSFKKGELLALQDEPCNRLIILMSGSVKGEMSDPSGKVVKVEDIHAPNPLAILFLFGENNRFPVQVTAQEEVTALVIPRESLLKLLSMSETLLKNWLDTSANFANRLAKKLHFMSFRTIRQKWAMYMLERVQETPSGLVVELDRTKSALAEYFGVSRPSLEREFTRMQEDGLIRVEHKQIWVKDRQKLVRLVAF